MMTPKTYKTIENIKRLFTWPFRLVAAVLIVPTVFILTDLTKEHERRWLNELVVSLVKPL